VTTGGGVGVGVGGGVTTGGGVGVGLGAGWSWHVKQLMLCGIFPAGWLAGAGNVQAPQLLMAWASIATSGPTAMDMAANALTSLRLPSAPLRRFCIFTPLAGY
jgi:hypothetical protein